MTRTGRSAANPPARDIARVVVMREQISARVSRLAAEVARRYEGRELTILAVLTGSLIFLADLIRELPLVMRIDLVSVSSYPGAATASRGPELRGGFPSELAGKSVLIVDDILDSGRTLADLVRRVRAAGAADVRSCVLLRKHRPDLPDRPAPDFFGFDIADEFVVGYGLDYNHLYRNLPEICVLADHALAAGREEGGAG